MRKGKILSLILALLISLSTLSMAASANPTYISTAEDWGDARWIWSSASTDRGPAKLWKVDNFSQFIFDSAVNGPSGSTQIATYNDLAAKQDVWMNFRRDFTLSEIPDSALTRISVDSKYWMWINGKEVVWEGQLKRGPTQQDTYYDTVDIAEYLQAGSNSICIQVWHWGGNKGFSNNPSGSGGFLFYSDLIDERTDKAVVSGDGEWKALKNPANLTHLNNSGSMLTERNVRYDARLAIDWINPDYDDFTDDGWNTATVLGISEGNDKGKPGDGPWNELWERPIPQWRDYGRKILPYELVSGYTRPNGQTDGQRYQIKLPYNAQMVPYIKLGAATEAGKTIEIRTDTYTASSYRIWYDTIAGEQEFEGLNWLNGDFVYFDVPVGVEVIDLGYRETSYDVPSGDGTDFEGYFDSVIDESDAAYSPFTGGHTWNAEETNANNNFYDELWKKAARTVLVTVRDQYMDCPDRERSQYIGDAINEMEEGYYSLGTGLNDLNVKAVKNIVDWQFPWEISGRTYYFMSNVRPGLNKQEISSQSLGTALAAINHYLFTGDAEMVQYAYQALYNYLTNYDMVESGNLAGLVAVRPASDHMYGSNLWDWFDWSNNADTQIQTNVWWYISAKSVRQMADVEGVASTQAQKDWLDARLSSIEANFDKFWNEDLQAYATPWSSSTWKNPVVAADRSHLVDERVNALGVVSGLIPEERYSQMRDVFIGTDTAPAYENSSIYMEKYSLEALYKMGYPEDAMYRMQKRHMRDVNIKADSTLPEYFNGTAGSWYTKNHGWSGGGMIAMSRYAAGVAPTSPGYGTWSVIPQMGNFLSIDTRVPSEIGNIDVNLDKTDGNLTMTVVSPGGDAKLYVPVENNKMAVLISGNATFVGIEEKYNEKYAVYQAAEAGTYEFETTMATFEFADPSVTEYEANQPFDVIITTPNDATKTKIINEAGNTIGKLNEVVTKNADGTKSYRITLMIGTPGEKRTMSAMVMGQVGDYKDAGASLDVKIVKATPVQNTEDIISASSVSSAGVNTPFTVTVVTSASVNKVKIVGETGASIGTLSSSVVTSGNTKVWTISIKVGSKGSRTLTALGAGSTGGYGADGKSFNITIRQ